MLSIAIRMSTDSGKHSPILVAEVGDVKDDEEINSAKFPIDRRGTANTGTDAEIHIVKSGELNSLEAVVAY